MTAAWMVYALLVGGLIAAAAHAIERVCRLAARPGRWVWAGAMVLTIGLIAIAPRRAEPPAVPFAMKVPMRVSSTLDTPREMSFSQRIVATLSEARSAVAGTVEHGLAFTGRLAPPALERGLAALWISLSALALALIFMVHARFHRIRRGWPVTRLHGTRVRLAPEAGPAVVGLTRPEIMVPRWLLLRSEEEQQLVLVHEREHVRARDPLLIFATWVAAALVPWHPAIWWMLSRLRLSVELDCDERVLRTGVARRSYGALLIELAGRCSGGMRIGAPALADRSSHLKRRLLAMTPQRRPLARASGGALVALSAILFILACDARLPSSSEIEAMDVAAAEGAAQHLKLIGPEIGPLTYTIDGKKATALQARALGADTIATINVMKKKVGEHVSGEVRIITKGAVDSLHIAAGERELRDSRPGVVGEHKVMVFNQKLGLPTLRVDSVTVDGGVPIRSTSNDSTVVKGEPFNGLLLIDGVRSDRSALASLTPGEILSVEVLKGPAARRLYPDSTAARGVIKIRTRGSSPEK